MKAIPWEAHDAELAAQLWKQGESASMISAALDGRYTRSAVLGKISRMRLTRDPVVKDPKPAPEPKRKKADPKDRIRKRHIIGQRPPVIANSLKLPTSHVIKALEEMGLDPNEHDYIPYHVHPMWSMDEGARRLAFYDKFRRGWAEVQKRLAQ